MDHSNIDYYWFTCKLLNICANKALMEEAMQTRETILCAAELIRYIFDHKKTVVPVSKELEMAGIYIDSFWLNDQCDHSIQLRADIGEEVYIDHLELLSFVIHDHENEDTLLTPRPITYLIEGHEELLLSKVLDGKIVLTFPLRKR